jgi:hypothetical protein
MGGMIPGVQGGVGQQGMTVGMNGMRSNVLGINSGIGVPGRSCPPIELPPYARYLRGPCQTNIGARCYITCNQGFDLIGSCFKVCGQDGKWSGSPMFCTKSSITCPPLDFTSYPGLRIVSGCQNMAGFLCMVSCGDENSIRRLNGIGNTGMNGMGNIGMNGIGRTGVNDVAGVGLNAITNTGRNGVAGINGMSSNGIYQNGQRATYPTVGGIGQQNGMIGQAYERSQGINGETLVGGQYREVQSSGRLTQRNLNSFNQTRMKRQVSMNPQIPGMGNQYPQNNGMNGRYPQQGMNGQYPQDGMMGGQFPQQGYPNSMQGGQYPNPQTEPRYLGQNPTGVQLGSQYPNSQIPIQGQFPNTQEQYPGSMNNFGRSNSLLQGVTTLLCQSTGMWSGSLPICSSGGVQPQIGMNGLPGRVGFQEESFPGRGISEGTPVGVRAGARGSGVSESATILNDYITTTGNSLLDTMRRGCSPLRSPPNGEITPTSCLSTVSSGTSCNISCRPGFRIDGSSETTCDSNGRWSQPLSLCEPLK